MGTLCVERDIYCRRAGAWAKGNISVYQPFQDLKFDEKGDTWRCDISIEWQDFSCRKNHYGSNGYQALELALRLVPSLIAATDDFHKRNLALYSGDVILDSASLREFFHARLIGDV
ncbi:MAG: hypothetical protein CVT79_14445 [Alphaproteobacteria bacterium HGW-Alphaproteobacteria-18]|nr:MAG: hypothetical protein CVT79_14445 [Alphaproteobacteria bacterium HGW-Alphaproteobacteria-18]